jgi:hypothetical protein
MVCQEAGMLFRAPLFSYITHTVRFSPSHTDVTVIQNERGDFSYAELDRDGKLIPTENKVGLFKPRMGHPKNLRERLENIDCNHFLCPDELSKYAHEQQVMVLDGNDHNSTFEMSDINLRRRKLSPTGIRKNLVVLMRFQDHKDRNLPTREEIDILFNGDDQACSANTDICGDSGSVKSYWKKFSHGNLEIQSTVADWVTIDVNEADAADNNWG